MRVRIVRSSTYDETRRLAELLVVQTIEGSRSIGQNGMMNVGRESWECRERPPRTVVVLSSNWTSVRQPRPAFFFLLPACCFSQCDMWLQTLKARRSRNRRMAHAHCARQGSRLAVIGPVACEQVAGESWTALGGGGCGGARGKQPVGGGHRL